ncbi:MAG: ethanolamine utilization protein EutH [Ruthenibacterium sp.]
MNIMIAILLCFALFGAADKIFGGRLGVAESFDRGLDSMGSLCLSMAGIYCIAVTALSTNPAAIAALGKMLPFDASVLAGALLAPDLGGYAIASQVAASVPIGQYSGLLLASTLGGLISFVLPVSLGNLRTYEVMGFMQGILWGVIALPAGLIAGAFLLGLPPLTLWQNLWPVLLLCVVLCVALRFVPRGCIAALTILGKGVWILGIVLFCVVAASAFLPTPIVPSALFAEVLTIVFKITLVVCGSMVACQLLLVHCGKWIGMLAQKLGINDYAVLGLLMSLVTSVSMLPLYSKMDVRGKVMNAAFTVSGAFVFGGQFAFVSSVTSGKPVAAYIICKLMGGCLAVLLAVKFTKNSAAAAI